MKKLLSKRILSIVLILVMLVGVLPMTANAAAEVTDFKTSGTPPITYTDGAVQYLRYNNYLYKVTYTNLKLEKVALSYIRDVLILYNYPIDYVYLRKESYTGDQIKRTELPTSIGGSLNCYTSFDEYANNRSNPVVTFTCMAVGNPVWTWSDTTSATAKFASTDGNAAMTVNAVITSSTQPAENCLGKGTVIYTATATANGQTYTNTKTVDGDAGPHDIKYEISDNTITANCKNDGCPSGTGNSVTLNSQMYYYTGSPIPNPVTGGFNHNMATYKVTYNGSEDRPSAVGNYRVELTVYDENGTEGAGIAEYIDIAYLPSPEISAFNISSHGYYDNTSGTYWFAPRAVAEVTPLEGYKISKTLGTEYGPFVYFDEGNSRTVYLMRISDGAMTDAIDLGSILKWDTTAPTGSIKLSPHTWDDLNINSSFTVFSKDSVEISITARDTESGVKSVQYYVADRDLINGGDAAALEAAVNGHWRTYDNGISLPLNDKYVVYAKITDNVSNVTYLSSDGIVLYSDATSTTTSLTTTYKAGEGRDISIELNGNTVNEVTCGNVSLGAADYTVSGGKITLESAYLDTLAAGEYTITVSFNPQGAHYMDAATNEKPAELTVRLTVNKREVAVPTADPTSFVYNGSEQTYNITPSDWYTVTGDKRTNAGTYTVNVSLKDKNSTVWNDGTTEDKTYEFHIAKATYDMTGAKWDYDEAIKYDGKAHSVWVDETSLPNGVSVSNYTGNTHSDVGKYTANVSLNYDYLNYNEPDFNYLLDWEIVNNWTPTEYTVSGEGWMNQDFVITPADGYLISLTNTANGTWEDALTYSEETDNGSVTFYLKNETDDTISLEKTVSYRLDKTDPTGKVEFVERTGWEEFVHNITFGLFYKDEVTVKVTANDTLSDVSKIEYASSNAAKTLNEVKEIADWTEYNGSFGVTKPEAEQFVYFIRITDKAGNVTYLSTDGAQYDTTPPAIEGIENGKTYYTTQKVTVTDTNLETVTLNGEPATGEITLEGNKEVTYTIVATDKAGNVTTVAVTMKPIVEIGAPIDNITEDEVKSSDKDTIQNIIEIADELLSDDDLTDDEKAKLEGIKSEAEKLVDKIDEVAKATDTENTEKVKDVTAENATPENKTDLEKAKEDLEKALEDNDSNMTEDEKKAVEYEIKRIDDALEVIDNVEKAEELIDKLTAVDTVKPDDEEVIKAITDAQTVYNALSDYEKSLVDEDTKASLDKLVAALVAYDIIEGDGSSWTEDSDHSITFVVNGLFSKFVGIKVDGKNVDKANYEAKTGSTIITLKTSYLDTLKVGEHTITVVYTDGSTDGTFNVRANANSPANGDSSNIWLWIALLLVSGTVIFGITLYDRKRKAASKR